MSGRLQKKDDYVKGGEKRLLNWTVADLFSQNCRHHASYSGFACAALVWLMNKARSGDDVAQPLGAVDGAQGQC
jgi:hypothetical protein